MIQLREIQKSNIRTKNKAGGIAVEELTRLIREDMKPALGVTEPGAIAFAVASAGNMRKVK